MDKPRTTPKDFFLWAGAIVSLYASISAFLGLIFDYINYSFPNVLQGYYTDPYQSGISYEMASLIVMFPIFFMLMRFIHRDIAHDATRRDIWVRRWALVLTLFIAGVTMAIDLIVLLNTFLRGETLTTPFLLKIALIFLVAAGVGMHFIADLRGYWEEFPERARRVGYGVVVLALITVGAGFFIVGTPMQARACAPRLGARDRPGKYSVASVVLLATKRQTAFRLSPNLTTLSPTTACLPTRKTRRHIAM